MDLCGEGGALVNLTFWKLIPKWLDSERTRPTFSEHVLCIRVGQSVESALITLAAIFLAHSACFNNFRQKYCILTRRDKRESYLIVLQQNNVYVC